MALAVLLVAAAGAAGQGNHRDADIAGSAGGLPLVSGLRRLKPGTPLQLQVQSPQGTLAGLPWFLAADLQGAQGGTALALPGEPGVLGITTAFVAVVNGFSLGPSPLLATAPSALPAGGFGLSLLAPPAAPGTRVVFQAAVADPGAPNGLAITALRGGDYPMTPVITPLFLPLDPLAQHGYGLLVRDLDGDGHAEIVSGARLADIPGVVDAGRVFIYSGTSTTPVLALTDPAPDSASDFGASVDAGDFNGDGWTDLAIGARLADVLGNAEAGKVVIFYGPTYASTLTLLPPQAEFRGRFGHWTACGDFDGDGFCDLAVASIGATVAGVSGAGRVDVFFGPSFAPSFALVDPAPGVGDRFSYRIEATDFNHDGFTDLAVAAPFKSLTPAGTDDSGALWVFSGPFLTTWAYVPNPWPSQSGLLGADLAWVDVNGDGWQDVVAGAELDNSGGLTDQGSVFIVPGPQFTTFTRLYSPQPSVGAGFGAAVAVADFNHDQVPDLLVGEFWYSGPAPLAGRSHVLYGPDYLQSLSVIEPVPGSSNEFGRRIRAGDLNADGYAEMVIGVPFSSASGIPRAGAVYIVNH